MVSQIIPSNLLYLHGIFKGQLRTSGTIRNSSNSSIESFIWAIIEADELSRHKLFDEIMWEIWDFRKAKRSMQKSNSKKAKATP